VLANRGDYDEAKHFCERAIELSRAIGHLLVTADTMDTMAFIRLRQGSADEAATQAEEAARLFLELGASQKAAQSLDLAARAWEAAGDGARARETRSRARALA
jgi:tetratricopeptide (TPR) repeat protein